MDHPNPIVTLSVDVAGLSTVRARNLRFAVATVEQCLELWQPFVAAATSHPLPITVATAEGSDSVRARLDLDRWKLLLQVPPGLLREPPNRLAAQILDAAVPALVLLAEHHPHPELPAFWKAPVEWQPSAEPDDPEAGIRLEDLLDGDPLVVGRHDGTPAGRESREDSLREDLCERLEAPGIAVYDHLIFTGTVVGWNLELLPEGSANGQ